MLDHDSRTITYDDCKPGKPSSLAEAECGAEQSAASCTGNMRHMAVEASRAPMRSSYYEHKNVYASPVD